MRHAFDDIMAGKATHVQIASFMIALKMRGETPTDIAAGVDALRAKAHLIQAPKGAIDIVGTGGDNIGTFNISTAAAFVVAGAGIVVAKHGNKAVSSKSGASDVLSALGVNIDCPFDVLENALEQAGIAFLMAPRHHAAMRHVAPVRSEIGVRTIFNLLGPLSNPALVTRTMIGCCESKWLYPFAEALAELGTTDAWIVHGADGLDEVSTTGSNQITCLRNGKITSHTINPTDIGLPLAKLEDIKGGDPTYNAQALRSVLAGDKITYAGYRDIVLLNAAASMVATGHEKELQTSFKRAQKSLDSGAAEQALNCLIQITKQRL